MNSISKLAFISCITFFSYPSASAQIDWMNGSWYNKSSLEVNAGKLLWQPLDAEFYSGETLTSHVYFVYDEAGRIIERTKCDANGVYDEKIEQTWNADGMMATYTAYKYENEAWTATHKYVYTYDPIITTLCTDMEVSQVSKNWEISHQGYIIERDDLGRTVVIKKYYNSPDVIYYKYEFVYPDNNPNSGFVTVNIYSTKNNHTEYSLTTVYSNLKWEGEWTGREAATLVCINGIDFLSTDGARILHTESRSIVYDKDYGTMDYIYDGADVDIYTSYDGGEAIRTSWRHYMTDDLGTGVDKANLYESGEIINLWRYRVNDLGYTTADAYYYNDSEKGLICTDGFLYDYVMNDEGTHAISSTRYYAGSQEPVSWKFGEFVSFENDNSAIAVPITETHIAETLYYDLMGCRLAAPAPASLTIKVERLSDGTSRATKLLP